jgi:hypothetical protein
MEVTPREVDENKVSEEAGSPTSELPHVQVAATWSEQDVETFVNHVILVMRSMVARMSTFSAMTRVNANLVSLFELLEPDDWITANAPTHCRLVRAYLRPQGSLLASLLELDVFHARLRDNRPASPVFNDLTLDEGEEGEEPQMQEEEENFQSRESPDCGGG